MVSQRANLISKFSTNWHGFARHQADGANFASIGKKDDLSSRDDWNDPDPLEARGRGGGIPSGLPVNASLIILAICVGISLLSLVAPNFVYGYLALTPAYLFQRPWTIITHMFVHQNLDHLFWNMFFLFFFALPLEQRVGGKRFLEIYFFSGIVGAIAQMAVSGSYIVMMGASAALYGTMGCLAIIAPEISVLLFFVIPLRIQWAILLYAAIDFAMMGAGDNVAHMAHIAGLLVGVGFGYIMKNQPRAYYR